MSNAVTAVLYSPGTNCHEETAAAIEFAGGKAELFSDDAITARHQSSGGILRRAGILARGAMLAAVGEKCPVVTTEHVRVATTETL